MLEERLMKIAPVLVVVSFSLLVAPAGVKADDDALGRKLCMTDVFLVCAQYIPDRERITHCLISNRKRISQPCRQLVTGGSVTH
jgi:hypothetical protein